MNIDDSYDNDDSNPEDEYITVNQELIDLLEEEIEFERQFYRSVCDTDDFQVILIPDESGYIPTREEIVFIEADASQKGIKSLYRISHGNFASIFDPETGKIGIISENNKGFAC